MPTYPADNEPSTATAATAAPAIVAWLGYGGLIPFVMLASAAGIGAAGVGGAVARLANVALLGYGAVILSFVGALHWGFAMTLHELPAPRRNAAFLWSTVPALLAWAALLVALVWSLAPADALLIVSFLAQYARDAALTRLTDLPAWYLPLRLRLTTVACLCLAIGGFTASTAAAATPTPAATPTAATDSLYRDTPPSADGIGKIYEGREIAHVMGYEGAEWLDRPEREREERPDLLVEALHLQPGMTVADIGAGSGYLSRRLAPLIAPGRVLAVDVQPQMVALLDALAQQPGLKNISPQLGTAQDVKLPDASVDLAVMVDVYHELAFPYEVMQSILRALKPGGRVVFVEYRAEDPRVPIKALHKMSEAQVRREMRRLPLTFERSDERLPLQHLIVFRKALH